MASKLPHRFLPLTIQIGVLASSPGSCFAYGQKQDIRWKGLTQLTQVELTQELTKLLLYEQFCLKVFPLHAACKTILCYIDVATWSRNLPQAEEEKKKDLWGWEETAAHSTHYLPVKAHWFLTSISQTPSVLYRMWPSKEQTPWMINVRPVPWCAPTSTYLLHLCFSEVSFVSAKESYLCKAREEVSLPDAQKCAIHSYHTHHRSRVLSSTQGAFKQYSCYNKRAQATTILFVSLLKSWQGPNSILFYFCYICFS